MIGRAAAPAALLGVLLAIGCDVRTPALDPSACDGETWPPEPARAADDVVEALSIATFLGGARPPADDADLVRQRLSELGVRHVSDPSQPDLAVVRQLAGAGVRFRLGVDALGPYLQRALADSTGVDGIQVDFAPGDAGPDLIALQDFCLTLFSAVKAARAGSLAVFGPDIEPPPPPSDGQLPVGALDFSTCVDFGLFHRPLAAVPPGDLSSLDNLREIQSTSESGHPRALGFHGYSTATGDGRAVSAAVQAKYVLRLVLEAFNRGYYRVFAGTLVDRATDPQNAVGNQGLVRRDGSAKPAFGALANLIALLADPGDPITTHGLGYRIDGAPAELHHALLEKRDGTVLLALWLETTSTDTDLWKPISVRFPAPAAWVKQYAPQSGTTAGFTNHAVSQLNVMVGDQVTLLHVAACGHP